MESAVNEANECTKDSKKSKKEQQKEEFQEKTKKLAKDGAAYFKNLSIFLVAAFLLACLDGFLRNWSAVNGYDWSGPIAALGNIVVHLFGA